MKNWKGILHTNLGWVHWLLESVSVTVSSTFSEYYYWYLVASVLVNDFVIVIDLLLIIYMLCMYDIIIIVCWGVYEGGNMEVLHLTNNYY